MKKPPRQHFPALPGIYQMLDGHGGILYIGKAKHLRNRLASYFKAHIEHPKTRVLMRQVVDVQVTVTRTENEALLLESQLIKQYKPRYNILLKDDKTYPYLYLSTQDPFPRLSYYRGRCGKKGRYFGPYPNAKAVKEALALLQPLFQVRQCSNGFFHHRSRPCLQYQIKRCTAPCVGFVTEEDYAQQVRHLCLFLEGKSEVMIEMLIEKMRTHAQNQAYESAAHVRDQIAQIRALQARQCISGTVQDIDVVGVFSAGQWACVTVLYIRQGRVIGQKPHRIPVPSETEAPEILNYFLPQYYSNPSHMESMPARIIVSERLPDKPWMQSALSELLDKAVVVVDVLRGQARDWVQMAITNAEQSLSVQCAQKGAYDHRWLSLQQALKLPVVPKCIACFDISHSGGEATFASCVVFDASGPVKKEYRRFAIRGITPGDDYAAMGDAITRYVHHRKKRQLDLPDVLLIDGGKGQWGVAASVLAQTSTSGITLVGVAKGPERKPGYETLWMGGHPYHLPPNLPGFHLIQAIRDEAHRFALSAHRQKRIQSRVHSVLDDIPGIGPSKRKALLHYFGGLQGLRKADVVAISQVPGIHQVLAQRVYQAMQLKPTLHPARPGTHPK